MGRNFFDVIKNTIEVIQQTNRDNPREETAEPTVFDLIKEKIQQAESKRNAKRVEQGKKPSSILDLIKDKIEEARGENRDNPDQKTAPPSIFDKLQKKVELKEKRRTNASLRTVIEDYGLDISGMHQNSVRQIQDQYRIDIQKVNKHYAHMLHDMANKDA
ncbi:MAG: hypothetical protein AB8B69_05410 [Chitinophagales bacterium]